MVFGWTLGILSRGEMSEWMFVGFALAQRGVLMGTMVLRGMIGLR